MLQVFYFLIRKQSYKSTRADWLKIVFLLLDGDIELAQNVDVMMAEGKRIYILIIKVNKLFSFSRHGVF